MKQFCTMKVIELFFKRKRKKQEAVLADDKTKVLLLAPTSATQGGIANWTRLLLHNSTGERVEYDIIDTSVHYRVLGEKTGLIDRYYGLKQGVVRALKLIGKNFSFKPDIVYFTCAPSVGFAFRDAPQILLCKLLRRKVVIHLRGGKIDGFWGGGFLRRFLANMGSKLADYIFVITKECQAVATEKFGHDKVVYIPNFIDVNLLNRASDSIPKEIDRDKFNIIHVAFQCREKGTFEIIEAAKNLPEEVNVLLIGIVSEGNRIAIEKAIQKAGVAGKVQLLGAKNKPQLWDFYNNADLFLFPSHTEGFPNVIMEAMLYGLPILATGVGDIENITNATGDIPAAILLENVDPPSPYEIADKANELIKNKDLRRRLSENSVERVRKYYSLEVVIPELEAVLQSISTGEDIGHKSVLMR